MFLIRYFKGSIVSLKKIFELREEKMWKVVIYFLLMAMVSIFPYNFKIVQEQGFKMGFVSEGYKEDAKNALKSSRAVKVGYAGLRCNDDFETEEYLFSNFKLIIDYKDTYKRDSKESMRLVIMTANNVKYYNEEGIYMPGNYEGFSRDLFFSEFISNEAVFEEFFSSLEKSFSAYTILFSVINYTITSLFMDALLLALMAGIFMMFKIGFNAYVSYFEMLKMLVLCMTIPTLICFILGFFDLFALTPVIMNFGIGVIGLLIVFKVIKPKVQIRQRS